MKRALRSFGMGMSMAIAAAIAAVPTAYAADATDSSGPGNRGQAQSPRRGRSGPGLERTGRCRRPAAQLRRTRRRQSDRRRLHLQPLPGGPGLRRPPRRDRERLSRQGRRARGDQRQQSRLRQAAGDERTGRGKGLQIRLSLRPVAANRPRLRRRRDAARVLARRSATSPTSAPSTTTWTSRRSRSTI